MFLRGQIGPCAEWLAKLDVADEFAAVEKNWLRTGKMLSWNMFPPLRIIGPKFMGAGEDQRLSLWLYTFRDLAMFKEWALGAPEHIALHTKVIQGMKAALGSGEPPLPTYSFHATDDPTVDIAAVRAELRDMYSEIEQTDWADLPPGVGQNMMLGDHD